MSHYFDDPGSRFGRINPYYQPGGGDTLAATQKYNDDAQQLHHHHHHHDATVPQSEASSSISPSKNKYKFTRTVESSEQHTDIQSDKVAMATRTQSAMSTHSAAQHSSTSRQGKASSHPSLQEVQERLRAIDNEHRMEARRRLQASEARKEREEHLRRQRAEEERRTAMFTQGADLSEYAVNLRRVEARPVPSHEASFLGGGRRSTAEEFNANSHSVFGSQQRRSGSASPEPTSSRVAGGAVRSASVRSATTSSLDDPLAPVGKRIDPNDVYYKPVQGRLQSMIYNRNNAHDVASFSRFHPTAATAVAGGRHEGIVSAAAPAIPANLRSAANSSTFSHSFSVSHVNTTQSTIEAYTREVEAAQIRRIKGQAAIIHAHQAGDPRPIHYDPLMVVRPVEWKEKDPTVLHGAVPRATLLRQKATQKKIREIELKQSGRLLRSGSSFGTSSSTRNPRYSLSVSSPKARSLSPRAREASASRAANASVIPNTFGTSVPSNFTPHPMGFEDLPPSKRRGPTSPANSSVAYPAAAAAASSSPPRYVLPDTASVALFPNSNAPLPRARAGDAAVRNNAAVQQQAEEPAAFTIEAASNVDTQTDTSVTSDAQRVGAPSEALIEGRIPDPPLTEEEKALRPHPQAEALPFHSKVAAASQKSADPHVDALVRQLLEKQAQQQEQIERLLKLQESAVGLSKEPSNAASSSSAVTSSSGRPAVATQSQSPSPPASRYSYYQIAQTHSIAAKSGAAPAFKQPYVSPSRSLPLNDLDVSGGSGRGEEGGRGSGVGTASQPIGANVPSAYPRAGSVPTAQQQQQQPHAWWERHSPDAAAPPYVRERTSSPNNNIAAAFAYAAASANAATPRDSTAVDDDAVSTALSPMSDEGRTPSPAPSSRPVTTYAPQIVTAAPPSSSSTPLPSTAAAPNTATAHRASSSNSNAAAPTHSVGAIAQLFRGSGAPTTSQPQPTPRSSSGPFVRNDLFRPSGSVDRGASSSSNNNTALAAQQPQQLPPSSASHMSFREAFDSGAPLPYDRPAVPQSPEQPVAYYADEPDDGSSPPAPNDPAAMLLMQMAGMRSAMGDY